MAQYVLVLDAMDATIIRCTRELIGRMCDLAGKPRRAVLVIEIGTTPSARLSDVVELNTAAPWPT